MRDLKIVVVSLAYVGLVGCQMRVDEDAGRDADTEGDSDAALVPQGCAGGAEAEARWYCRGSHVSKQRNYCSMREDGVVGGLRVGVGTVGYWCATLAIMYCGQGIAKVKTRRGHTACMCELNAYAQPLL